MNHEPIFNVLELSVDEMIAVAKFLDMCHHDVEMQIATIEQAYLNNKDKSKADYFRGCFELAWQMKMWIKQNLETIDNTLDSLDDLAPVKLSTQHLPN